MDIQKCVLYKFIDMEFYCRPTLWKFTKTPHVHFQLQCTIQRVCCFYMSAMTILFQWAWAKKTFFFKKRVWNFPKYGSMEHKANQWNKFCPIKQRFHITAAVGITRTSETHPLWRCDLFSMFKSVSFIEWGFVCHWYLIDCLLLKTNHFML